MKQASSNDEDRIEASVGTPEALKEAPVVNEAPPMDWIAKGKRPFRAEGKRNFEYPHELKVEVVMEVLRGTSKQAEIGERYGVPQSLVSIWRKTAIEGIVQSLDSKPRGRPALSFGSVGARDRNEIEDLVLRIGANLRENTALLERTLRLMVGRSSESSEAASDESA